MKRYEVRFSSSAEADLDSILLYIAADNPVRAITFVEELRERTIDFLSVAPNAATSIGRFKYVVFGRYIVAYTVDDEAAVARVQLVTEGHRDWHRLLTHLK
ncbi:MAG: type II toxin-antitoxin system RelE/ParE family toxin [Rhizobiaceae bacterium]|nr:type II toxin-antitoxin system RelE/ParE family toxin [Rhizobiaceae bacterium]